MKANERATSGRRVLHDGLCGTRRDSFYKVRPLPSPPAPTLDEFADIPDAALYRPTFSPWLGEGDFKKHYDLAAPRTMVRYQKPVEESLPVVELLEAIMFS